MTKHILDLIQRLGAAEAAFQDQEILAPIVPGHPIRVRIAGMVQTLRLTTAAAGWQVVQPTGRGSARPVRPATRAERQQYLQILSRVFVLALAPIDQEPPAWIAVPAGAPDRRFGREIVQINLTEANIRPFDLLEARTDGRLIWFARITRRQAALAQALRGALAENRESTDLAHISGLTPEHRTTYRLAREMQQQQAVMTEEDRLRAALAHAGATMLDFVKRDEGYTVAYQVDGNRYTSHIGDDLSVQTAGICLSGGDRAFDLTSLVGVLREGRARGRINRMDLDTDDDD